MNLSATSSRAVCVFVPACIVCANLLWAKVNDFFLLSNAAERKRGCLRETSNKQPCRPLSISGSALDAYDERRTKIIGKTLYTQAPLARYSSYAAIDQSPNKPYENPIYIVKTYHRSKPILFANIAWVGLHPRPIYIRSRLC